MLKQITNIVLNLQNPNYATVYAMQADSMSRFINATLLNGSTPWTIPAGVSMLIRYRKPDNTVGFYDTNEAGDSAYTLGTTNVEFELVQQALTVAGDVLMALEFYDSTGASLSTFTFRLIVPESPLTDGQIISSDYFNVLTASLAQAAAYMDAIKAAYGAPLTASTAAGMTDTGRIYVYTGSETGYTFGHWYYWDGSAWTDGGVYNATAISFDNTFTADDKPPSAEAVGAKFASIEEVSDLKNAFDQYSEGLNIEYFSKTNVPVNISDYLHSGAYVIIRNGIVEYETGNNYKYYEMPTTNLHRVYVSGCFTASNIKGVVFTDDSLNVKGKYPAEDVPNPGLANQSYECFVPDGATKLFIVAQSTSTVSMVKLDYFQASADLGKVIGVKDLSIEGYEKNVISIDGTLYPNKMWNGTHLTDVTGFYCLEFDVNPNTKYILSGTGNPMFSVYDSDGNRIDWYRPGSNVNAHNYEYTTSGLASKVYLNRKSYNPIAKEEKTFDYVKTESDLMGIRIGENKYRIGKGLFKNEIGLFDSLNGAFNFTSLTYDGATFKSIADDIAPIYTDAEYAGANHGYNFGYTCTASAHGLTESDIGKTYNDGTNTWILLTVLSADTFMIGCYDSSVWYKLKAETVPGSVDFGTVISITASSKKQIRPCIKNISVSVFENSIDKFRVMETYDIIDIGTGIDALISNQGNNTNESLVELSDSLIRVSTLYDFNNAGSCTLYEEIELLKSNVATISYAYGTQVQAFSTSDKIAVLGTTVDTLQTSVSNFIKSVWKDENITPSVYIKMNSANENGFVIAYIKERTLSTAGEVNATSKKLYPRMIGTTRTANIYKNIMLRMPIKKNSEGADFVSYANVGNDVYVFVGNLTAKTVDVSVPADIFGKSITVVDKNDNITIQTQDVVSTIKVITTGEGWALLKVS